MLSEASHMKESYQLIIPSTVSWMLCLPLFLTSDDMWFSQCCFTLRNFPESACSTNWPLSRLLFYLYEKLLKSMLTSHTVTMGRATCTSPMLWNLVIILLFLAYFISRPKYIIVPVWNWAVCGVVWCPPPYCECEENWDDIWSKVNWRPQSSIYSQCAHKTCLFIWISWCLYWLLTYMACSCWKPVLSRLQ